MTEKRNPRFEPRAGDVLLYKGSRVKVRVGNDHVVIYEFIGGPHDGASRTQPIRDWLEASPHIEVPE